MAEIELKGKKIFVTDQSTKDILAKGHFGSLKEGMLSLSPEETLYLIDARNFSCRSKGKDLTFNDIAILFSKRKRLMARYFTYKDWRERGLVIKDPSADYIKPNKNPVNRYPGSRIIIPSYKVKGDFFEEDLMTVVENDEHGKRLYEELWFGQYGTYKAADRGKLNKLDIYETLFLIETGVLKIKNASKSKIIRCAKERRSDFLKLYQVYSDWRELGYVIKTGFKFGTHFRIYFPGARPIKDDNWMHSKHVIHVFPKESRLLISEWARAIRVAHSVRKTFILAIPGTSGKRSLGIDYILYHRTGPNANSPENSQPKYAMLSISEEEYIGGRELAGAIEDAKDKHMELVVAITDRETSVTYYKVRQIELPGSSHEYYEIDWMQP
jgi:tRNA-intron lyase